MTNPLKLLTVSGALSDLKVSTKICNDYCNINIGIWEIALADISFSIQNPFISKVIFELSLNLVNGYSIKSNGGLTLQNLKLHNFELPVNEKIGLINLPIRWYTINNFSDNLIIYFKTWPYSKKQILPKDGEISISVLLKRIK